MSWKEAKRTSPDHLWRAKAQYFCQMLDLATSEYINVYRFSQILSMGRITFKDCSFFEHNGVKYTHILFSYPAKNPPQVEEDVDMYLYLCMRRHPKKFIQTTLKLNDLDYAKFLTNCFEDTKYDVLQNQIHELAIEPSINDLQEAALRMVFFAKTIAGAAEEHNEPYTLISRAMKGLSTGKHPQFVQKGLALQDYRNQN